MDGGVVVSEGGLGEPMEVVDFHQRRMAVEGCDGHNLKEEMNIN